MYTAGTFVAQCELTAESLQQIQGGLDCRQTGCAPGQWCQLCWASYQCIPEGAVC
jgi:hypothetical protein